MLESALSKMYKYRLPCLWGEIEAIAKLDLTVPDLIPFDHYHYCGTGAIDLAVARTGWTGGAHILDIGSGIGGTARYLAWQYGLKMTAIELQPQLHQTSQILTERTGLKEKVSLYEGNFLDDSALPEQTFFDGWIALMVFLHISDREKLLAKAFQVLKPDGRFYIEDYFQQRPLTDREQQTLTQEIACPCLPTQEQYIDQLERAGFREIEFENVTSIWQDWVQERYQKFHDRQNIYHQRHGAEMVSSYLAFYDAVATLFAGGNLGGARIWGKR